MIEARERVGGRTWSRELPNGAVIEMGAEFVLPGNDRVTGLAADLGVGLWDKGMRYGEREPRGGIGTSPEELASAVAEVRRALERPTRTASARELLDALPIEDGAREAILARAEISTASSADEVPTDDLAGLAHIGTERAPSIAGGSQRLALGLAAELDGAVRLADPAVEIGLEADGIRVRTTSGAAFEADLGVVAVPASVIGRIEFVPELRRSIREAIALIHYGHAAKLFVPLAEPVPPSAVMNVPERYWCWTAKGEGDRPMPVVSCFAGSREALERLEVAAGPDRWLESLAALRPDLSLEPDGAVLSTWEDDPWVRAAYSVSPPPEVTAALTAPVDRRAFAGEHLAGADSARMEGAIRSGHAAAASLLSRA